MSFPYSDQFIHRWRQPNLNCSAHSEPMPANICPTIQQQGQQQQQHHQQQQRQQQHPIQQRHPVPQRHPVQQYHQWHYYQNQNNQQHQLQRQHRFPFSKNNYGGGPGVSNFNYQDRNYMYQSDFFLSKTLSSILRHNADRFELSLMPGGFLYVDDILDKVTQLRGYSAFDVRRVVQSNDKKRFSLVDEQTRDGKSRMKICANQGHSLEVEGLELTPIRSAGEVKKVIHGTTYAAWKIIKMTGLKRMARNHIHFAAGEPGENGVISGMRKSSEVMIYINLDKALKDGLTFFRSANNVILSPGNKDGLILPCYFEKALDRKCNTPMSRQEDEPDMEQFDDMHDVQSDSHNKVDMRSNRDVIDPSKSSLRNSNTGLEEIHQSNENSGTVHEEIHQSNENSGTVHEEIHQSNENSGTVHEEIHQSNENSGTVHEEIHQSNENSGTIHEEIHQSNENSGTVHEEIHQSNENSGTVHEEIHQSNENSGTIHKEIHKSNEMKIEDQTTQFKDTKEAVTVDKPHLIESKQIMHENKLQKKTDDYQRDIFDEVDDDWEQIIVIKDVKKSADLISLMLFKPPSPIGICCVGVNFGQNSSHISLLMILVHPKVYVYHLHDKNTNFVKDGHLDRLLTNRYIQKVFHDISDISSSLIREFNVCLDGTSIWDIEIMCTEVLSMNMYKDKMLGYKNIFKQWKSDNEMLGKMCTNTNLDMAVVSTLFERGKLILKLYTGCRKLLPVANKKSLSKKICDIALPDTLVVSIEECKQEDKKLNGKEMKK